MESFISQRPYSARLRHLAEIATSSTVGFLLVIALMVEGCVSGHDRPHGHGDVTFGITPRGDALVFNAAGMGGHDLYLLDLETLRVKRVAATPDYEVAPEVSPDGKSIVYAAGKPG